MEQKLIIVPFEVELAKKITSGEVEGKIVTRDGKNARIVCWDYKSMSGNYPILALIYDGKQEASFPYSEDGRYNIYGYNEEDSYDLILAIPEYMTFKDGDVIAYDNFDTISITMADVVRNANDVFSHYYAELRNGRLHFYEKDVRDVLNVGARLATEAEKQKIIEALKESKEPKAKECLKILGIEAIPEYNFKPFDKVLVRQKDIHLWVARFFDRMSDEGKFVCTDSLNYEYCIPYNEETKHLHNTTEKY